MGNGFSELIYGLDEFSQLAKCELDKIIQKGNLTPAELDSVHKIAEIAEKIKELDEYDSGMQYGGHGMMSRYNDYYGGGMGYSEARDRSPVTGRYISRGMNNGYSGHSIEDRMIASLEQQMDSANSDYEKKLIEDEIKHIRMGAQK